MHIDNSYLSGLGFGEIRGNAEAGQTEGSKSGAKSKKPADVSVHVRSPEINKLRQLVQVSPDVRPEVIARVSQVLESGFYTTAEAATQTADAMIQAIE